MTKQQEPNTSREGVIGAILRAGDDADPERLARWAARHPEFRDDILALAGSPAGRRAGGGDAEAQFQRLEAEALARADAYARRGGRPATLRELVDEAGMDLPELARRTRLPRGKMSDVEQGLVSSPLPTRLVMVIARVLRRAPEVVEEALRLAAAHPSPMHAKAVGEPSIRQVSWRDFIEDSDMSDREKAYWLDGA